MWHVPAIPRPSPAAVAKARSSLERRLGPSKVLVGEEACASYATDESLVTGPPPDAVVLAECAEDILDALAVAADAEVPITPRAGGSGRTGGAVPVGGGIVLCTRGMATIRDIDRKEGVAVVGPGTILADLHRAVEAEGWFYPPDPNSAAFCALGGNVAENAGGPRAFKYGVTRDFVLGMEALLMGGQRIFAGRRTKKGVTGYDVAGLLVGSEGTLAVFGDITLRLVPAPERVMTLLALFERAEDAALAVEHMTSERVVPRCVEFLDATTLAVMREAGNAIDARAGAMLIIEVDGTESDCELQSEKVSASCDAAKALDLLVAQNESQRARLWASRREMSYAVRRKALHKVSEDVVVPRSRIGALLTKVKELSERHAITALSYGHAGDGNLHVNFLWNDASEEPRVQLAVEELFRSTVALGGTLSGEHGIGLVKAPYLHLEHSPELIALQQRLKATFDPRGLLNPGKIFAAAGHQLC
jgi:glycolate oxidase